MKNNILRITISLVISISFFNIISQPVFAQNTNSFSNLWNNILSIFGGNKPNPTPTIIQQKKQLLQQSVEEQLKDKSTTPTPQLIKINNSLVPLGTVEKIMDYKKYPEAVGAFLPRINLLEESKKYYASNSGALQFFNSFLAQVDTENVNEKIIHVKPGYCTMKLFTPEAPTGTKTEKSVSQKSYQEIKMLDCRGKRE